MGKATGFELTILHIVLFHLTSLTNRDIYPFLIQVSLLRYLVMRILLKMVSLTSLLLLFLSSSSWAHKDKPHEYFHGYPKSTSYVNLPEFLEKQISNKYGKFRLARKINYCSGFEPYMSSVTQDKDWSYGAIPGDFNGDGHTDYTMIVRKSEDGQLIWLLAERTFGIDQDYLITDLGWPSIKHFNHTSHVFDKDMCEGLLVVGPPRGLPEQNQFAYIGIESPTKGVRLFFKEGRYYESQFHIRFGPGAKY